jgi:phage terminase large subunit
MTLKPTRTLRKILALTARIWGIQGGQGAGKTIAILWIIIDFAFKQSNKDIYVVSAELSKMRKTVIKDFLIVLKALGHNNVKLTGFGSNGTPVARFANGSVINFIGLDKDDIGKGLRSDLVFLNEANKTNFETYRELTARAKRVILDFNPNEKFWYHREVMKRKDCQHIKVTYLDNEFCPESEVKEIKRSKELGFYPDGKIKSEYWANKYNIYGLGEIGGVEGRIFYWKSCSYLDYLKIPKKVYFGNDWGKSDPWAIGEAKYHDGKLYVHERNYKSENQIRETLSDTEQLQVGAKGEGKGIISYMFNKLAIGKEEYIICDNNKEKVTTLRKLGWDYAISAKKGPGSITAGIDILQNIEVVFTEDSENIEFENENYCWEKDPEGNPIEGKPKDANNHHIDWIRYLARFLSDEGIINAA